MRIQFKPALAGPNRCASSFRAFLCLLALQVVVPPTASAEVDPILGLDEAIRLAERDAPALQARHFAVEAAERQVGPAGELPDPELIVGIDNLPINGEDAGSLTADFMTMRRIGVMQEFPRRQKRDLRTQRAQAGVELEQAQLVAERLGVREFVAQAWVGRAIAERRLGLLESLRDRYDSLVAAADAALAAGRGSTADALAARANRVMLQDRIAEGELGREQAIAELARWLPQDARRPLAPAGDWSTLQRPPGVLIAGIAQHRELLRYAAEEHAAQTEIDLAQAEKRPDWAVELSYAQRGPAFSNMVSVMVRMDLPLFAGRRQDPLISAKRAAAEKVSADREQAQREHLAVLRSTVAAWSSARDRTLRYQNELLPLADDQAKAALAAYRGGGGSLISTVDALRQVVEVRLAYVDRQAELGKAWAQLRFAFPEGH